MAILGWDRTEGPRRSGSVSRLPMPTVSASQENLVTPGNMICIP